MKVLHYQNRKTDPFIWDTSTPAKELDALYSLFLLLEKWGMYDDIVNEMEEHNRMRIMYNKALTGDKAAAKRILLERKNFEYQFWMFSEVLEPSHNV